MRITAEMLKKKGADCNEVAVFKKEWKDGVEVTIESIGRAVELELSVNWFATHFLPTPQLKQYEKDIVPLWEQYLKDTALFRRQHLKAKALLPKGKQNKKAIFSLREQYEKAQSPMWKQYDKGRALLFLSLWQEGGMR